MNTAKNVKDRPRLGRGLKGLISTPVMVEAPTEARPIGAVRAAQTSDDGLRLVPLDLIDPNPHQPRERIDPAALAELVASVKTSGILQPVLLRPVGERYQLVAGHRRTEASRLAGLKTIPAIVRSDSTDELQAEWALIENIQRQDLNGIERAKAYRQYIQRFQLTHAQAAARLGEDRTVISNFLRLLDLNPFVQDLVASGLLSSGHAKVLAGVNPGRQDTLAHQAVAGGLSVRRLEELVHGLDSPEGSGEALEDVAEVDVAGHTRTLIAKSAHIVELEQTLSRKLGTKLRIFPSKRKNTGKIVIQYFSLDEFDRIIDKFS